MDTTLRREHLARQRWHSAIVALLLIGACGVAQAANFTPDSRPTDPRDKVGPTPKPFYTGHPPSSNFTAHSDAIAPKRRNLPNKQNGK